MGAKKRPMGRMLPVMPTIIVLAGAALVANNLFKSPEGKTPLEHLIGNIQRAVTVRTTSSQEDPIRKIHSDGFATGIKSASDGEAKVTVDGFERGENFLLIKIGQKEMT